jgi:hypothetical protein
MEHRSDSSYRLLSLRSGVVCRAFFGLTVLIGCQRQAPDLNSPTTADYDSLALSIANDLASAPDRPSCAAASSRQSVSVWKGRSCVMYDLYYCPQARFSLREKLPRWSDFEGHQCGQDWGVCLNPQISGRIGALVYDSGCSTWSSSTDCEKCRVEMLSFQTKVIARRRKEFAEKFDISRTTGPSPGVVRHVA